jgi:hypothetical protein
MKAEREGIYLFLQELVQEELNAIRNTYEFGDICKEEFEEMSDEVQETYVNCLKEMALCDDTEVVEKMSNVLASDFKFKGKTR